MEIKPTLLKIWKKQGLSQDQITERAGRLGYELPADHKLIGQDLRNPRPAGSIKNYPMQSFRPTPETDTFLQNLPKRSKSAFINKAIKFYIESQN